MTFERWAEEKGVRLGIVPIDTTKRYYYTLKPCPYTPLLIIQLSANVQTTPNAPYPIPNCEVKRSWGDLVLWWVTTWETSTDVCNFFFLLVVLQLLLLFCMKEWNIKRKRGDLWNLWRRKAWRREKERMNNKEINLVHKRRKEWNQNRHIDFSKWQTKNQSQLTNYGCWNWWFLRIFVRWQTSYLWDCKLRILKYTLKNYN